MPQKTNYAFDFAAEIVSDLPFGEIPYQQLHDAILKRLNDMLEVKCHDVFSCYDSFDVEPEEEEEEE